jgi:hypothetical protein
MSDDDDEVAIDDGPGDAPAAGAAPSEYVVGGAAARGRVIDPATRAAFKAIVDKNRGSRDDEDDDGMDVAITDEPAAKSAPAAAAPAVIAPPPGAAALVPEVVKQHEAANARQVALDAREKQIAAREAELEPLLSVRDAYLDDRLGALTGLLKQWGIASDADLKAELADLVTEISSSGLGVSIDPQVRARMDSRRALKKIDAYKSSAAVKEKALAAERDALAHSQWRRESSSALHQEITKPDSATAFPYLSVEDNAGEIVLDIIVEQNKRDGSTMQWRDAAKLANDYLKQTADAYLAKRRHLFSSAPMPGSTATRAAATPQGDPSGVRRSRTLPNSIAAAPQGAPPSPKPGESGFSMSAHREATKHRFRSALVASPDDE